MMWIVFGGIGVIVIVDCVVAFCIARVGDEGWNPDPKPYNQLERESEWRSR